MPRMPRLAQCSHTARRATRLHRRVHSMRNECNTARDELRSSSATFRERIMTTLRVPCPVRDCDGELTVTVTGRPRPGSLYEPGETPDVDIEDSTCGHHRERWTPEAEEQFDRALREALDDDGAERR